MMTDGGDVLVRAEALVKTFERPEGAVTVLKGVNIVIGRGEAVAVVGVSGAGKSTLLHVLGALEPPSSGTIAIDGQDLARLASDELAAFRNRRLGFVFQFHHLLPEFTALENTMMPALIARIPEREARKKAESVLNELGLAHRVGHKAGELSGGEQQRVAIARAVILEPSLILADEPTGNLDAATGGAVEDILMRLNRDKGITLMVVTHNEALARRLDRVIRIRDGMVVEDGE
jgi:lipoprotein-releasing system ATP-binding protein